MLDNRARRQQLIAEIEALRGSRLITYVTSDRDNCQGQIDENVVRPMYDHLLALSHDVAPGAELPRLDLFLYSRGGAVDAPWRIVSMIRAVAVGFTAMVPFRAQSAATMITLGADEIILGRKGELGPIDPSLGVQRQGAGGTLIDDRVSVEDVMSYVKFVRDKAGITDQSGLAAALAALTEYPGPLILGTIYRTHAHIRSVAERLLESREHPFDDQRNQLLINTLAERTYAHGHAIGRSEATEMGLPIVAPEPELERLMWELFVEYENDLLLNDPDRPRAYLDGADERSEPVTLALVESSWGLSTYDGMLTVKAARNVPQQLNVDLNLHVQMPDAFNLAALKDGGEAASAELRRAVAGQSARQPRAARARRDRPPGAGRRLLDRHHRAQVDAARARAAATAEKAAAPAGRPHRRATKKDAPAATN